MANINILITICLINVSLVSSSRILVLFYHPGPSHFQSFYPLFNELAERGHNVTVLTYTHVKDAHKNYHELLLSEIPVINASITYDNMVSAEIYQYDTKILELNLKKKRNKYFFQLPLERSIYTMHAELLELYYYAELERELALNSSAIDQILEAHREQPFDIVLMEQFITDFLMGLIYKLNVPFIGFSTCSLPSYYYNRINLPDFPSFVPFAFADHTWDMNFIERTVNWLTVKTWNLFFR